MSFAAIFLIALALSMDAMAVSIGAGTRRVPPSARTQLILALCFGLFQALMPSVGYALGRAGAGLLQAVDHWIAFVLLAGVGGKMLWEGFSEPEAESEDLEGEGHIHWKTLLLLSVATSIDAAAVGLSFSLIGQAILWPSLVIGLTTFTLSWLGVHFGRALGARLGCWAERVGGIVLIAIGVRIVLSH